MTGASELEPPTRASGAALAALLLLIAGGVAIAQLLLPWSYVAPSVGLPVEGGVTGWNVFRSARVAASSSSGAGVAAYGVVGAAVAGLLLILVAGAVIGGVRRRPAGLTALGLSGLVLGAALWWLLRARTLLGRGLGQVFADAGPGWYLFLLAGPIGALGALALFRVRG